MTALYKWPPILKLPNFFQLIRFIACERRLILHQKNSGNSRKRPPLVSDQPICRSVNCLSHGTTYIVTYSYTQCRSFGTSTQKTATTIIFAFWSLIQSAFISGIYRSYVSRSASHARQSNPVPDSSGFHTVFAVASGFQALERRILCQWIWIPDSNRLQDP